MSDVRRLGLAKEFVEIDIDETVPASSDLTVDIPLTRSDFNQGVVHLRHLLVGPAAAYKRGWAYNLFVTDEETEATCESQSRSTTTYIFQSYYFYDTQIRTRLYKDADNTLTDRNIGASELSELHVALVSARISGSNLRLVFNNNDPSPYALRLEGVARVFKT